MANSAVSICSNALVLLGDQPIASFTDGDTGSLVANQLYTTTYHAMLTETLWHFATRTENLVQLTDKPKNNYKYKYQLPSDLLYIVSADCTRYEVYERELYSDMPKVQIEMIYPVDEMNLPSYFAKALEYNLASLFAIPVTGNATRADYYRSLYELELKRAKRADASQRPGYKMGEDRLLAVRNV